MRKFLTRYLPASMLLAFLAMIFLACELGGEGGGGTAIAAASARSGSIPINWSVSGTVVYHPIPVEDPTTDPPVFFLIQAFLKGAPGKAQFTVLGIPSTFQDPHPECDGNPGQDFSPNDMVITFEDLSMLFAALGPDGGWVCFQTDGTATAEAHMSIIGGTGKYQDASGWFIGKFNGQQVGISGLLQAETGTIEGEIEWNEL